MDTSPFVNCVCGCVWVHLYSLHYVSFLEHSLWSKSLLVQKHSLRKVFITESASNKLSSSHHALNSLLFALDGYPTATGDPAEIEETARTGTVGGGTGSGRERRDWVPLTGDPLFPSGRLYFFNGTHNESNGIDGITWVACQKSTQNPLKP